jgi:hypothetical protein
MDAVDGSPGWLLLRDATSADYEALEYFDCGSAPWEKVVNNIVRGVARSRNATSMHVRIALDLRSNDVVALCALRDDHGLLMPGRIVPDEATYIAALAVGKDYREKRAELGLPQGFRPGRTMLDDALETVDRTWPEEERIVWAEIAIDNRKCREMVDPVGFVPIYRFEYSNYEAWACIRNGTGSSEQ